MFSVPGWKISAPLKTQTTPVEPKNAINTATADSTSKVSKKRKRGADRQRDGSDSKSLSQKLEKHEKSQNNKAHESLAWAPNGGSQIETAKAVKPNDGPKAVKRSISQDNGEAIEDDPANQYKDAELDGEPTEESASKKRRKRRQRQKEQARESGETAKEVGEEPEENIPAPQKSTKAESKSSQPLPPTPTKLTPLQSAMRQKLISSRFRYLNETLYTTPSASSAELFKNNPTFFTEYHEGFARQVEGWPENPVDGFVNLVLSRGSISDRGYAAGKVKGAEKTRLSAASYSNLASMGGKEPLPRDFKSRISSIADLGCGAGAFAQQLAGFAAPLHLKIHSFDLAAPNEHITVADIRSLPLPDNSVDVTVFSLALMGTNWIEFIEEAWRVLRWKGECWVADVNSRFAGMPNTDRGRVEHSVGKRVKKSKDPKPAAPPEEEAENEATVDQEGVVQKSAGSGTDVSAFVEVLKRRGFALVGEPDVSNKMFARMRFAKSLPPMRGKNKPRDKERKGEFTTSLGRLKFIDKSNANDDISVDDERRVLKPCVYKTR